ncbi:prepilin-type N-terminal cleavage/methylation domain-containing protein [Cyanobium sp. Cruz CV13-4-11]|jgi:prepilin-type N-terminal cleavage/methylation domain-containing protein|uniref:prepilin-type N-terminal cleavage/methylation domain-containing protein n=1 Tax=unclassified Cyanobium TaxID=2627006 RepID=UPI0020CE20E2|nr:MULTISPECIES: prepilin-type N-terminal cleavage/methylation domain-containing protein [unclassified Cyanobium]MCP9899404.1 prepilin-type N-terminal cleavage/methylation domain-containing protein [Cyanobium sp. Cruz CV11-17]MCP9921160.1 prepilin-type N-terminal cleavage/methylation domain-containing protein [Cyanobium sp. Cruz CV13-4-11]
MPPSTERPPTRPGLERRAVAAFSLVELLVSVVILGLLSAGAARVLTGDLVGNSTLQTYQRLRRQVGRARRFLELETATATRLQWQSANSLRLSGVNNGTAFTISYDLVPAASAGISGVTFRGPFVLRRNGPPYSSGGLLSNSAATNTVVLDGLANEQAVTVSAAQTTADRSARVTINLSDGGTTYSSVFSLATAAPSGYGLLQFSETNASLSGCSGDPNGCRQANGIQEWDTRLLSGSSPITITPVGSPNQVIVYFNAPRSTADIRRAQSSSSGTCIRTSCYIDFASGSDFLINAASSRVDKLVFLDTVIAVPRQ